MHRDRLWISVWRFSKSACREEIDSRFKSRCQSRESADFMVIFGQQIELKLSVNCMFDNCLRRMLLEFRNLSHHIGTTRRLSNFFLLASGAGRAFCRGDSITQTPERPDLTTASGSLRPTRTPPFQRSGTEQFISAACEVPVSGMYDRTSDDITLDDIERIVI